MEILDNCLISIEQSNLKIPYEIIVIDNNSTDGSPEMVELKHPSIRIIKNKKNNLFAKANNQGAEIASGKYLLLLNSDTIVEAGNLEKLVDFIDKQDHRKIACVGPIVLNDDKTLQSAGYALPSIRERITMCFHLNRLLPRFLARLILPTGTPGIYHSRHLTGWISGCCMLIRNDVYKQLGGLNEELEFYGEEPEFCMRLNQNGYETWLVNDAAIIHLGGKSTCTGNATFLSEEQGRLRRYTALQIHTVGIRRSLVMSRVVLLAARLKYFFCKNDKKSYFMNAIRHEKAVINYMKNHAR